MCHPCPEALAQWRPGFGILDPNDSHCAQYTELCVRDRAEIRITLSSSGFLLFSLERVCGLDAKSRPGYPHSNTWNRVPVAPVTRRRRLSPLSWGRDTERHFLEITAAAGGRELGDRTVALQLRAQTAHFCSQRQSHSYGQRQRCPGKCGPVSSPKTRVGSGLHSSHCRRLHR